MIYFFYSDWSEYYLGLVELFLMALMLSMDAFAVAVCKGLALGRIKIRDCLCVGLWFGAFQALMPTLGYFSAKLFEGYVNRFSHWIACTLLVLIGVNMIKEALGEEEKSNCSVCIKEMLVLAVATSIDALAAGVSFALLEGFRIGYAVLFIGCITLVLSSIGVKVGSVVGTRYNKRAEMTGGIVLVLLGIKIVLEHYGIWF